MTRRVIVVLWIFGAAVMLWFFVTVALLEPSGGLYCGTPSGRSQSAQSLGADPVGSLSAPLRGIDCTIRDSVTGVPSAIWRYGLPLILGLALLAVAPVPGRAIARVRRRYVRLTVDASGGQVAEPDAIRSMLASFHQQLLVGWWQRLARGQPSIAFEVATGADCEGDISGQLSIVCPTHLADVIAGTFSACYRDGRLLRGAALPPVHRLVRLKKRNNLVRALRGMDDDSHRLMDSLLAQMTALGSPTVIQFVCVPTPAMFDRYRRSRCAAFERRAERGHALDNSRAPGGVDGLDLTGLRSFGLGQKLEGALRVLRGPLFFSDIRVAGASVGACTSIASALREESAAENRLAIRNVRLSTGIYLRRLKAGIANPLPAWRRGVISSVELAAMWHVPSPAVQGATMARVATPAAPAPAEISLAPQHGLVRDERAPVGLRPEDKTDWLGLRGGHVSTRLPEPSPDIDWQALFELPSPAISSNGSNVTSAATPNGMGTATSNGAGPATLGGNAPATPIGSGATRANGRASGAPNGNGAPKLNSTGTASPQDDLPPIDTLAFVFDPAATTVDRPNERPGAKRPVGAPETFTELDLDEVRGLIWDNTAPVPSDRRPEPTARELEILAALSSYRFLFARQIHRRWWKDSSVRAAQQTLNKMTRAGWVRRFKFQLGERGAQQRVYCLARDGFELAKGREGRRGSYIPGDLTWREPQISDPRRILRDLHVNGWMLALEQVCDHSFARWRGPRDGRLLPPRRKVRGEWLDIRPTDVTVGGRQLRDYSATKFEPVSPDGTAELNLAVGETPLRLDLLIEFERFSSPASAEDRLRRYDGLISGWASMLDRYSALGTPPVVVFVCEDDRAQLRLVRTADKVVTARLAKAGAEEANWPCPGRKAMFFAVERDVHVGSLEALQLPEHPPGVRVRLGRPGERDCSPCRVHIIEPRLLSRR